MNDPTVIGGVIVLVLASLTSAVVAIINATSASTDRREAAKERLEQLRLSQETAKKADELIIGTAKIHELTNSTNSKLQTSLELKTLELASVRELMAQMERTAKEIAATRAVTDLQAAVAYATPVANSEVAAAPVLAQIETNTDATAKNTAKTDATVEQLKAHP